MRLPILRKGDWPTYNGTLDGNRNSSLDQVNLSNVSKLQLQWIYSIPFNGLETTPVVVDGVMYVTGNNQVYALSGKNRTRDLALRAAQERRGHHRQRRCNRRQSRSGRAGRSRLLSHRRCSFDSAHRLTGALVWDVDTPDGAKGLYGGTSAPLVVGDLVITGVSGGDNGIRGFVAAYKAATGELAWKLYTIPKPGDTGPAADTWKGSALALGGGATWLTGSADTESNVLYWAVGNPHPDTDGDERIGSQSLHQQRSGHRCEDWQDALVLPVHAARSSRLGCESAHCAGGCEMEGPGPQAAASRQPQRIPVCSGPDNGKAAAGDEDGEETRLGERHRSNRPGRRRCFPANETSAAGNGNLPRGARRDELVFNRLQSCHASLLRDDGGGLRHLTSKRRTQAIAGTAIPPIRRRKFCAHSILKPARRHGRLFCRGRCNRITLASCRPRAAWCFSAKAAEGLPRWTQHREVSVALRDQPCDQGLADDLCHRRQAIHRHRFGANILSFALPR